MVWGLSGNGLRTTISLEGFYDRVLANFLKIDIGRLSIPTGSILLFAVLAFLMWAFFHTKTGTAMTAVGSNPTFAKAAGINVDKMRMLSVVMSTWLAAIGILVYQQGFGFIQLYTAPFYMALPAVSAILIGGASVNKASIPHVILGTFFVPGHRDHDSDRDELRDSYGQRGYQNHRFPGHDSLRPDQKDGGTKMSKKNGQTLNIGKTLGGLMRNNTVPLMLW